MARTKADSNAAADTEAATDGADAQAADAQATDAPAEPVADGGTGSSGALTSKPEGGEDTEDKDLGEQRAEQQERAGEDPEDEPKPLSKSDNVAKQAPVTVAGEDYDLPLDTHVALASQAHQATAVDAQGVERVIDRYVDDWRPAPVHPDPDEVDRLERTQKAYEAHRKERQELLGVRDTSGNER